MVFKKHKQLQSDKGNFIDPNEELGNKDAEQYLSLLFDNFPNNIMGWEKSTEADEFLWHKESGKMSVDWAVEKMPLELVVKMGYEHTNHGESLWLIYFKSTSYAYNWRVDELFNEHEQIDIIGDIDKDTETLLNITNKYIKQAEKMYRTMIDTEQWKELAKKDIEQE